MRNKNKTNKYCKVTKQNMKMNSEHIYKYYIHKRNRTIKIEKQKNINTITPKMSTDIFNEHNNFCKKR